MCFHCGAWIAVFYAIVFRAFWLITGLPISRSSSFYLFWPLKNHHSIFGSLNFQWLFAKRLRSNGLYEFEYGHFMQMESDCLSVLCDWLSLSTVSSRFRDVPACSRCLHMEILAMHSFTCWWAHRLSSHPCELTSTCELSSMNTATINTDLQVSPWDPAFNSFEYISRAEIAGCVVHCISIIAVYPTFLSMVHKFLYCSTEICYFFPSGYLKLSFFLFFFTVNIGTQTTGPGGEGCSIPGQSLLAHRGPSSAHSAHGVRLPTHCGLLIHNFGWSVFSLAFAFLGL